MNRRRAPPPNQKSFVAGGVYDPNTPQKKPTNQQQTATPQRQTQQQQQQQPQQQQQQQQYTPTPIQKKQVEQPVVAKLEPPPEIPFKDAIMNIDNSDEVVDANGKLKFKQIFMNRKKPSVRMKEKRIRQNRRLRKTLIPKNGLMALNELKGVTISEFTINQHPGGGFAALVTVNSNQYEGRGSSKSAAKNNACEKALRDFIIAKLRENPRNAKLASSNNSVINEPMDTNEENVENSNNINDEDDVPMVNLASFAIYKLFSDWESEGYVVPEMHPIIGGNTSDNEGATPIKEPKKAPIRHDLPQNYEAMHPASLLCMMRPGLSYVDKGSVGEIPNVLHSLGVTVDDQDFIASGRSKKSARRNVAALACNTLFNTSFELDRNMESAAAAN